MWGGLLVFVRQSQIPYPYVREFFVVGGTFLSLVNVRIEQGMWQGIRVCLCVLLEAGVPCWGLFVLLFFLARDGFCPEDVEVAGVPCCRLCFLFHVVWINNITDSFCWIKKDFKCFIFLLDDGAYGFKLWSLRYLWVTLINDPTNDLRRAFELN